MRESIITVDSVGDDCYGNQTKDQDSSRQSSILAEIGNKGSNIDPGTTKVKSRFPNIQDFDDIWLEDSVDESKTNPKCDWNDKWDNHFIFIWEENCDSYDDQFHLVEKDNKAGVIFKVIANIEVLEIRIKKTGDWVV